MPASFGPFFINSETFLGASGVWLNNDLTTCAPSGYYSNGVIQRYLDNQGVGICCLGPALPCPTCEPPVLECGEAYQGTGGSAQIYETTVGLGTGLGVALVGLNPASIPDSVCTRFPAEIGDIISAGASQFFGYGANNYNGASTELYDNLCYIGAIESMDTTWIGLQIDATVCDNLGWDCAGAAPPIVDTNGTTGYTRFFWDTSLVPPNWAPSGLPNVNVTFSNYNVGSDIGGSSGTQSGNLGLDGVGACVANDAIANCHGVPGWFYLPIVKTDWADQQVEIMFCGTSQNVGTGYEFNIICPKTPTPFEMSDLLPLSATNDPLFTPNCDDGDVGVYPNALHQISLFNDALGQQMPFASTTEAAAVVSAYGQGILAQHSFAYQNSGGTGLRWNEGGVTKYEWYRVNLVTGGDNALKAITIGTSGQSADWQEAAENTAALIQIDNNGIITRIVLCNV